METSRREAHHTPVAELVVQVVWVVGVLAAYFAGAGIHPLAAVAVLAATFGVTLLFARLSTGWRAVPAMFATLTLQAPLLCGLGLYALGLPLGHHPYLCFFWHGTSLQLVEAFAVVAALSVPIGFMTRLERGGLRQLHWFARRAAPVAALGSAVLVVLGAVRLTRYPTPDHYLESLPLHATIPTPRDQPCTPIENKRDPNHDSGWERDECATPEFNASPLSFHYHVDAYSRDPESKHFSLQYRTNAGYDRWVGMWFWGSQPPEVPVRRDDSLDAWVVQAGNRVAVVFLNRPRWGLDLSDIRKRVAPPLGWTLLAGAGLLVALACFGASSALGGLAAGRSDTGQEWIARRRGDLSLIALASVLCSSALLAAALFAGFLT